MIIGGMDSRLMRAHNSGHVLRIVREFGPLSRADITRKTRLSPPTVSALISDLINARLVTELGAGKSKGGRRPQLLSFNAGCGIVLGAKIGTTATGLALSDMNGTWLARRRIEVEDTQPRQLLRRLAGAAEALKREVVGEQVSLLALVVGAPGMTDMDKGVVIEAANLEGWVNVPARDILSEAVGVPVLIENDINLAALGEQWRGGGRGVGTFVFISLGTGVGAGIVIDGKIHRGHKWHAGEISHLNLDFREWNTDFGAAGYLESYLGGTPRAGASRARRVHAEEFDGETIMRLGVAVANISTILDPDLIIFGGRRVRTQPSLLDSVHRVASAVAPNCPEIRATELGDDAALHGCVRMALGIANESLLELLSSAETDVAEQHATASGVHQVQPK